MKAIMKKVEITESNEALVNFAQTIDFAELFDHIKGFVKIDCGFQQPEINTGRTGEVYITFQSEDITHQTGTFSFILKECVLGAFSNSVYREKETGELGYWVSVSLQYQHKDGGSNGMDVCRAWYTDSKGWIFKNTAER